MSETSPIIKPDPTINVKEMIENAVGRVDDLRIIEVKRIDDKFANIEEKFKDIDIKYQIQFGAAKEAVSKAEAASEKRFDSVNEFRATLSDQQRSLMPRTETEITFKGLADRIDKLENKAIMSEGKGTGINQGWGWAVAVVMFVIALIGFITGFVK